MVEPVDRKQVQRLVAAGAQLLEVLPTDEFEEEHLPDAISLPFDDFSEGALDVLDPGRPVIVYCWDGL